MSTFNLKAAMKELDELRYTINQLEDERIEKEFQAQYLSLSIMAYEVTGHANIRLSAQLLDLPIEDLDVNVRIKNCLKSEGFKAVRDFVFLNEDDFIAIPNMGRKCTRLLIAELNHLGIWRGSKIATDA